MFPSSEWNKLSSSVMDRSNIPREKKILEVKKVISELTGHGVVTCQSNK